MARKIIHQLVDDMDGSELPSGGGETIHFSLEGRSYEIDLSSANADQFREALAPFVKAARRHGGTAPARRRPSARNLDEIRAWARENGHTVSDRGRIPGDVEKAYEAHQAHARS